MEKQENRLSLKKNRIGKRKTHSDNTTYRFLQYIAIDLIGPIDRGINDEMFALIIICKTTKYVIAIPIHRKSSATVALFKWIDENTSFGHEIKHIHSDCGKEFVNYTFQQYCKYRGIVLTTTAPHSPQHNGLVERFNGTLVNMTKAMIKSSNLNNEF